MQGTFAETLSVLESDRRGRGWLVVVVAALVLMAWGLWAGLARVGVVVASEEAWLVTARPAWELEAPVAGTVAEVGVRVRDRVAAGEALVVLEANGVHLAVEEAEARLRGLRAEAGERRGQAAAVEARRTAAERKAVEERRATAARLAAARGDREQARADLARLERLVVEGVEPRVALERARSAVEAAEAEVEAVRAEGAGAAWEARSAAEALRAEEAALAAREAELRGRIEEVERIVERLRYEASRRVLRSPAAGVVGRLEVASAGARLEAGDPVATVVPEGGLRVVGLFPAEEAAGRVAPGQRARVVVAAVPGAGLGGVAAVVERVETAPARNGVPDARVRVELALTGGAGEVAGLRPGMRAEVRVEVERTRPALLLLRALGRGAG